MSWTTITCPKPVSSTIAPDAIRVSWAKITRGGYIAIRIGSEIARLLGLVEQQHAVRLMRGTDNDAGKLAIAVDQGGTFTAKRQGAKGHVYRITISAEVAKEQGFASGFESFTRDRLEVIKPQNGQPRYVAFLLTRQFLAADA